MYCYKLKKPDLLNLSLSTTNQKTNTHANTLPDIHIQKTPLNKAGYAELLSIDLEYTYKINRTKDKIDNYNAGVWENAKKLTNPYEYVYIYNSHDSQSIANVKPLSRSFFKMIEMFYEFCPEFASVENYPSLITAHIAEGPGGFIEAVRYIRAQNTIPPNDDKTFGMTLTRNEKAKNVPGWKQSRDFLARHPEVHILNGADGTGDIYNIDNINFMRDAMGPQLAHLITGDGGFDFSVDYNHQEQMSSKLIYAQILCALKCQAVAGTFVCKIFDMNLFITTQMLYLLQCFYETVIIYKPHTSRIANSEKYVICRNFKGIDEEVLEKLSKLLVDWNMINSNVAFPETINYFFKVVPEPFISYLRMINREIIDSQIKSINRVIDIIKNKYQDIYWKEQNFKSQIAKAREWCRKYKIPHN